MRRLSAALLCATALTLGGCSMWPWSSSKKISPTPLSPITASAELRIQWRSSIGAADGAALRPAIVGDAIYAGSGDGKLARFELGKETWRISVGSAISAGVAANESIVVVGNANGQISAYEVAGGKLRWKVTAGGEPAGAPAIVKDLVVVRVGDNQLLALSAADGSRRWIYQRNQVALSLRSYSGILPVDDSLVAGFAAGKMLSIAQSTGLPRWEASVSVPKGSNEIERLADLVGDPVLQGNAICMSAFQGRVACVDATRGSVLWSRDVSSPVGVAVDERQLYIVDDKGALHGLDIRTGASAWKQDKLLYRNLGRPLVVGPYVAVADSLGWLHLVNRQDGELVARVELDSSGVSAPLSLYGDRIVAQSRNGSLYALSVTPKP